MMIYHLAADAVLLIHLTFILFALFGALLGLRQRWILWLHLPAAIWAIVVGFMGWICPLTPLENFLRTAAGEQGYSGGFIEHYVLPIIYPQGLTLDLQMLFGLTALTINLVIYYFVIRKLYFSGKTDLTE
ncbi:DUF2784 domain-containing protein [Ferrimonas sp. YFM]|uniref:DUF2784 domain-containing protein n=1 Tax=Ferrimonas sp. YFM TaxID=3028878 RepID=UPI002573ACF7|nr:DUF2784 domain-containing protein [Ferrimonas sp. YFM]BDY05987.1 hypothetical protein F0521_30280 [Ferrimonas sp. YFM]